MRFVCQIAIPAYMANASPSLAYIFITLADDDDRDFFDPDIIFPDDGENAVIVQPGLPFDGETLPLSNGPTLFMEDGSPAEFTVDVEEGEDPPLMPHEEYLQLSPSEQDRYFDAVYGNKIGGTPDYDEDLGEGTWRLLLQLNSNSVPFYLNLGASPQAMAFLRAEDGQGKLLIQDS